MLFQLHTGRVEGYREGQAPLIYIVSTVQTVMSANLGFVFSDGHGIASFTKWFDNISDLDQVDWDMVYDDFWKDNSEDGDRQRRKQAEFLVHRFCPWSVVTRIGVLNDAVRSRVNSILETHGADTRTEIHKRWYY
jgi:hypothetical protein